MRGRDQIIAIIAAHSALTGEVVEAARLVAAQGYGAFATHLDKHRSELNVAVGEFALWAESFGDWAKVDASFAMFPPAPAETAAAGESTIALESELRRTREALKSSRANVLATLADAREALRAAGMHVDHLTPYRRLVRLWAGEAVDLVTEVHRLTLADQYLRRLQRLSSAPSTGDELERTGTELLRQWMRELQVADREGELAFAEVCGYGQFVELYRSESA
jgi:hypothetical protein